MCALSLKRKLFKKIWVCIGLLAFSSSFLYASQDQSGLVEGLEDAVETAITSSNEKKLKKLLKENGLLEPEIKKKYSELAYTTTEEAKHCLSFFKNRRDTLYLGLGAIFAVIGGISTYQRGLEVYEAFNEVAEAKPTSIAPFVGGVLLGGLDFIIGTRGLLFNGGKYLYGWLQSEEVVAKKDLRQKTLKKAGLLTALAGSVAVTTGGLYCMAKGLVGSSAKERIAQALKVQKRISKAAQYSCKVAIKNVDATPTLDDGYRVLIDSEIPQGLSPEKVFGIGWFKELLPSRSLEEWFALNKTNYEEFRERYRIELLKNRKQIDFLKKIALKNKVTLLYRTNFNAAKVLKEIIFFL